MTSKCSWDADPWRDTSSSITDGELIEHTRRMSRAEVFQGLSGTELAEAFLYSRFRMFSVTETMFSPIRHCNHFILIESGLVKLIHKFHAEKTIILRIAGPGELIAGHGEDLNASSKYFACAMEPCGALIWGGCDFEMLERKYPVISANVCKILCRRLHNFERRFVGYMSESARSRVASGILSLLGSSAWSDRGTNTVSLRRAELAQFSGTSIFTVSRTLSMWERMGVIELNQHGITVLDIERFKSTAEVRTE